MRTSDELSHTMRGSDYLCRSTRPGWRSGAHKRRPPPCSSFGHLQKPGQLEQQTASQTSLVQAVMLVEDISSLHAVEGTHLHLLPLRVASWQQLFALWTSSRCRPCTQGMLGRGRALACCTLPQCASHRSCSNRKTSADGGPARRRLRRVGSTRCRSV